LRVRTVLLASPIERRGGVDGYPFQYRHHSPDPMIPVGSSTGPKPLWIQAPSKTEYRPESLGFQMVIVLVSLTRNIGEF